MWVFIFFYFDEGLYKARVSTRKVAPVVSNWKCCDFLHKLSCISFIKGLNLEMNGTTNVTEELQSMISNWDLRHPNVYFWIIKDQQTILKSVFKNNSVVLIAE